MYYRCLMLEPAHSKRLPEHFFRMLFLLEFSRIDCARMLSMKARVFTLVCSTNCLFMQILNPFLIDIPDVHSSYSS